MKQRFSDTTVLRTVGIVAAVFALVGVAYYFFFLNMHISDYVDVSEILAQNGHLYSDFEISEFRESQIIFAVLAVINAIMVFEQTAIAFLSVLLIISSDWARKHAVKFFSVNSFMCYFTLNILCGLVSNLLVLCMNTELNAKQASKPLN